MIPLTVPLIEDDDLDAVAETLRSGYLVQGPKVAAFEEAVAEVVGVTHAIAVSSGTAALHLALLACGVKPGDTVAVPTYSWPATANVVEAVGARCAFVDIEGPTWSMDSERLADLAGQVAAVIPVHPFGQMADVEALAKAAPNTTLIEDAACALGATRAGLSAGTFGAAGCFSFHPRKAVTTGEGGIVTTSDAALADRLRSWRNHGVDGPPPGDFVLPGLNYRMTEFQGALGVTQMAKFARVVEARRAAADVYTQLFTGTTVAPPAMISGSDPVYQSYVVVLPEGVDRAAVISRCAERGVQTQIGTIAIPFTRYYRERYGVQPGDFPVTEALTGRALTVPLFPGITAEQQSTVVDVLLGSL